MSEATLSSLIQILAILTKTRRGADYIIEKNMIISFLQKQFTQKVVDRYTDYFQKYYDEFNFIVDEDSTSVQEAISKINVLTDNIYKSISYKQRIYILINLIDFSRYLKNYLEPDDSLENYFSYVQLVSDNFKIDNEVYKNCKNFCLDNFHLLTTQNKLLLISGSKLSYISNLINLVVDDIEGLIYVLRFEHEFHVLKYRGRNSYYIDNKLLKSDSVYFFSNSSTLFIGDDSILFYNDINKAFLESEPWDKLMYTAKGIEYRYKNSNNGIKPFSFSCESNELVGIIGSSGSGKTTLLNLLNGSLDLHGGSIDINGITISKNIITKGFIGYVPQDDLLIEGLTVYENLLFSARLSKAWQSELVLEKKLLEVLELLQLEEAKDLKVGSVLQKTISGGQRKRLNIALEIIREPILLFIDEPTSGLSSTDSFHIIRILKLLALNHKLLFVNIHQPSNDVFYLFDKLIVLDKGGFPVFFGRPGDALQYFRNSIQKIESILTGKHSTEQEEILSIIEETYIDDFGVKSEERLVKPEEWYTRFKERTPSVELSKGAAKELPDNQSFLPHKLSQLRTYFMRNVRSKTSDKQYKLMAFLISPVLALILAFICKQHVWIRNGHYIYSFSQNDNIASFYFMSIIVAMFVGLIVSAEEVFRDKKLFVREQYLNLSKLSYYTAKVLFLMLLSLIQTLTFTLIAVVVLKLSANMLIIWLVLFLTSLLANVLGLILSRTLRSQVAIYIAIPLILVPQILLSGVVVPFDKLHPAVSSNKYVPFIGDIMPTRWAYEALLVNQFKNNGYEKSIFELEKKASSLSYSAYILCPELKKLINEAWEAQLNNEMEIVQTNLPIIYNELNWYTEIENSRGLYLVDNQNNDADFYKENLALVQKIQQQSIALLQKNHIVKDSIVKHNLQLNPKFKEENYNRGISDLMLNRNSARTFKIVDSKIIRFFESVFKLSEHPLGRSHFFASEKKIGSTVVSALFYNNLVLLFMILAGFGLLILEKPRKIKEFIKFTRRE